MPSPAEVYTSTPDTRFVLTKPHSFPSFCGLGRDALAAIKDLTVIHHRWVEEDATEQLAWERIRDCTGLRYLEVSDQAPENLYYNFRSSRFNCSECEASVGKLQSALKSSVCFLRTSDPDD